MGIFGRPRNFKDDLVLGSILGAAIFWPQLSLTVTNFVSPLLPSGWFIFGAASLPIFGAAIGALVAYMVGRT